MEEPEPGPEENICRICNFILSCDTVVIKKKGMEKLRAASKTRQDGLFSDHSENLRLHKRCRKSYTNPKSVDAAAKRLLAGEQPQSPPNFDFTATCLFCSGDASDIALEKKKSAASARDNISYVTTEMTQTNIIIKCSNRADQWSSEVLERIKKVNLPLAGARYHRRCFALFFTSTKCQSVTHKRGRPTSADIEEQMSPVFLYLETNEDSQHSVDEIKNIFKIVIDERTIIRKLKEKYGDDIIVTTSRGRNTIICFAPKCHEILRDSWYRNRDTDPRVEQFRIIQCAATIIRNDIRSSVFENSMYPAPDFFLENVQADIPETLSVLLNSLTNKLEDKLEDKSSLSTKQMGVAHSIISLLRPRTYKSPLLLGLGCLIHHKYASKYLIDLLSSLGYCAPYNEVLLFETSAIVHPQPRHIPDFTQFSFDNADFNVRTLDGLHTFHAMGGIQCNTPVPQGTKQNMVRLPKMPSSIVTAHYGYMPINYFCKNKPSELKHKLIRNQDCEDPILPSNADCLWLHAKSENFPDALGWSEFMEKVTTKTDFCVSNVEFLPFINALPSNYDTIYTSLKVAAENSRKAGMATCFVTFDQPLYLKAQEILHTTTDSDLKNIVLRLGGFHLLMSFLGAIGFIMSESGLKELWSCIYATNSIDKMLCGHSYARAVRAHMLTNAAIFKVISQNIELTPDERIEIEMAIHNEDNSEDCSAVMSLMQKIEQSLTELRSNGPTAQLWVQYFELTILMKKFIEAERTGNWSLHLETIKKMLPFFYSSGHFHYAKCASMYLDDMQKLERIMSPEDYKKFTGGLFTIRRTNKFWSGVWSDMTIEQTLMRTMKSPGGFTRGRGVRDSVLSKWILSLPIVQKVTENIEEFCNVNLKNSEQHMDSTRSRVKRDNEDLAKLVEWLGTHKPFPVTEVLISIGTGVVGGEDINCHRAREVGRAIMSTKVGNNYSDVTFSRKDRVTTLKSITSSVKLNKDHSVAINSDAILRRICFSKQTQDELKTCLEYELSPYPLSLFDNCGMRKTKKSALYDLFQPIENILDTQNKCYVIDGGYLLHKVIWQKGMSFGKICEGYVNYVKKTFGLNCIIVFDGYGNIEMNTKNAERFRRTQGKTYIEILFDENTVATVSQENLLKNEKNKDRLILMLKERFEKAGIKTFKSDDDADALIISKAVENASKYDCVIVVGEDVDLLVILNSYMNSNVYLMKPGRGKIPTRFYNTDSLLVPSLKEHILFLHAISGCDTTSALYRIGKKKCAQLIKNDIELKIHLKIFQDPDAAHSAIAKAGETFLSKLYGGNASKNLNNLRYERFAAATIKRSYNMASLPPTTDAAKQHIFRVYHQVQKWLNNNKSPTDWGWKIDGGKLLPVQTVLDPAPAHILQTISCRCKISCSGNCTCVKCGVKCTDLCANCVGKECHEASTIDYNIDSSDEEGLDLDETLIESETENAGDDC